MLLYAIIVPQLLLLAATAEATDCTESTRCRWLSLIKFKLHTQIPAETLHKLCSYNVRTECTFNAPIFCPTTNIKPVAATRLVEIMTYLCSPNGTEAYIREMTNCNRQKWREIGEAINGTCGICNRSDCGYCTALQEAKTCVLQHGPRICGHDFAAVYNIVTDPVVFGCEALLH